MSFSVFAWRPHHHSNMSGSSYCTSTVSKAPARGQGQIWGATMCVRARECHELECVTSFNKNQRGTDALNRSFNDKKQIVFIVYFKVFMEVTFTALPSMHIF